jgi:hypothetical protein
MMRLRRIEAPQMTEAMPIVRPWLLLRCRCDDVSSAGDEGVDFVGSESGSCRFLACVYL